MKIKKTDVLVQATRRLLYSHDVDYGLVIPRSTFLRNNGDADQMVKLIEKKISPTFIGKAVPGVVVLSDEYNQVENSLEHEWEEVNWLTVPLRAPEKTTTLAGADLGELIQELAGRCAEISARQKAEGFPKTAKIISEFRKRVLSLGGRHEDVQRPVDRGEKS